MNAAAESAPYVNREEHPTAMSVQFIHLRNKWKLYNVVPPKWHYESKGGMTIAYAVTGTNVRWAYSKCSHNDNFNRKIGRDISTGRLLGAKCYSFEFKPATDTPRREDVQQAVLEQVELKLDGKDYEDFYWLYDCM
jgi:hypothetical protein